MAFLKNVDYILTYFFIFSLINHKNLIPSIYQLEISLVRDNFKTRVEGAVRR